MFLFVLNMFSSLWIDVFLIDLFLLFSVLCFSHCFVLPLFLNVFSDVFPIDLSYCFFLLNVVSHRCVSYLSFSYRFPCCVFLIVVSYCFSYCFSYCLFSCIVPIVCGSYWCFLLLIPQFVFAQWLFLILFLIVVLIVCFGMCFLLFFRLDLSYRLSINNKHNHNMLFLSKLQKIYKFYP